MTKIIINADDFGKSLERNRAIDDSFKKCLIQSAGLIVTGIHLQDAVNKAFSGGYLDKLHLHFNLSANLLHENSNDAPLTEEMKNDAFFCKDRVFQRYKGLPKRFADIRKWKVAYCELVAQFERFKDLTKGKANYKHVDFHLWYNLSWPVSIALNLFTWKYNIESVRYWGIHQKNSRRYKLYRLLSWNPRVSNIPSTNIDYYITKRNALSGDNVVELYCHPNYKDGVFLDDSPSYLGHERQPMLKHIQRLNELEDVVFISWEDHYK